MNFPRIVTLTAVLLTPLILGCQPQSSPEQQLLDNIAGNIILPIQQQFAQHSVDLKQASEAFCQQPTAQTFEQARQQWHLTMDSWQASKVIAFGPIDVDNKSWQIQFWPDKHNLIGRKLNELLNSDEPLNVERIQNASVVTQGLSALEYLLFDEKESPLSSYQEGERAMRRCQLLLAVSRNTVQIAESLAAGWSSSGDDYITHFTHTGADNTDFPDTKTAISALVDSLVVTIEAAKRSQLAQPLGYGTKGNFPRPYLSEAWRSRHSTAALRAHLQAAENLYLGGDGYGMDDYLLTNDQPDVAAKIKAQFTTVNQLLEKAPVMFEGVTDKDQRAALEQVHEALDGLLKVLKYDLPPAMGVKLGFNANDGD